MPEPTRFDYDGPDTPALTAAEVAAMQAPAAPPATPAAPPAAGARAAYDPDPFAAPTTGQPAAPTTGQPPADPLDFGLGEPAPRRLAGKYATVEDLERGYQELERRLGAQPAGAKPADGAPPATDGKAPAGRLTAESLRRFATEYRANGGLSEATLAEMDAAGLDRQVGESVVLNALYAQDRARAEYVRSLVDEAGGQEAFEAIRAWSRTAIGAEDRAVLNRELRSGDRARARLALRDIKHRYERAMAGPGAQQVRGRTGGDAGLRPFRSFAEMMEAQKDPRYASDPAYQADFQARLERSGDLL